MDELRELGSRDTPDPGNLRRTLGLAVYPGLGLFPGIYVEHSGYGAPGPSPGYGDPSGTLGNWGPGILVQPEGSASGRPAFVLGSRDLA